jgi:HAD superfamily hydrolase (TIGR01509 family)
MREVLESDRSGREGERRPEDAAWHGADSLPPVLEAVLFDWGETLVHWEWSRDVLELGHEAGLRAIGHEPVPGLTARFVETYLPLLDDPGTLEAIGYADVVHRLLADAGIDAGDPELALFVDAEHEVWFPQHSLDSTTHALLEALRGRGLKLGIVSNAFDPPELLRRDLDRLGITERVDAAVFASEAGVRKPHPAIFRRVLDELGVGAEEALFVGDSLATDLGGAAALGMRTCQSLWFRADEDPDAREPDFRAFTQMDVLTAVNRLSEPR